MPTGPGSDHGLVRSASGGVYEVELRPGKVVEAALRGRLKQEARTGDAVVVGDRVTVVRQPDGLHTIEAVEPRRTELIRTAPGRGDRAKAIAANLDQLVAVFSAAHPAPHLRMLDRFLVLAESSGLDAVVVANKMDRATAADRAAFEPYERIGYPVLYTSAVTGEGVEALRGRLCGRASVLSGPSGVGKSSLLNAIQPGLGLRVGQVSEVQRKGRHTTVSSRLIPLDCGGHVADTPGLRELGLWRLAPADLDLCFPELRGAAQHCRFGRSCSHTHEPGCGVLAALEGEAISRERYESYAAILEDATGG